MAEKYKMNPPKVSFSGQMTHHESFHIYSFQNFYFFQEIIFFSNQSNKK